MSSPKMRAAALMSEADWQVLVVETTTAAVATTAAAPPAKRGGRSARRNESVSRSAREAL